MPCDRRESANPDTSNVEVEMMLAASDVRGSMIGDRASNTATHMLGSQYSFAGFGTCLIGRCRCDVCDQHERQCGDDGDSCSLHF